MTEMFVTNITVHRCNLRKKCWLKFQKCFQHIRTCQKTYSGCFFPTDWTLTPSPLAKSFFHSLQHSTFAEHFFYSSPSFCFLRDLLFEIQVWKKILEKKIFIWKKMCFEINFFQNFENRKLKFLNGVCWFYRSTWKGIIWPTRDFRTAGRTVPGV